MDTPQFNLNFGCISELYLFTFGVSVNVLYLIISQSSPPCSCCEDINSEADCKCEQTPEEVTMEDDLDDNSGLQEDFKNINDLREVCDNDEDYTNYEYDRSDDNLSE